MQNIQMAAIILEGVVMIPWSLLLEQKAGDVLDTSGAALSLIDEGVYGTCDNQFCLADTVNEDGQDKLRLVSFYWAASEAAFRRAYFREVERDDMVVISPPAELIPKTADTTYGQIKQALKAVGTLWNMPLPHNVRWCLCSQKPRERFSGLLFSLDRHIGRRAALCHFVEMSCAW